MAYPQIDGRFSTYTHIGGHYIASESPVESSYAHRSPPFNDAPIGLLSSNYTGREEELAHIERTFDLNHGDVQTRCGIFGMLGLGKTQLALQYAVTSYERGRYSSIFWISGATVEKLNQGLAKVLCLVDHPDRHRPEQSTKLTSAQRWLEECTNWLLILDNVTQETVPFLREHLPRQNAIGDILLTTRTWDVAEAVVSVPGRRQEVFALSTLDIKDAVKLLLKEAGIHPNHVMDSHSSRAKDLVESLGRHPLAISQAASFAKQSQSNFHHILDIYKGKNRYELLSWENNLLSYEQKSVAVAFSTQFEQLEYQYPAASNLLKVLSFLDPEHIPLKMIHDGAEKLRLQSPSEPSSSDINSIEPKFRQSLLQKFKTKWHRRKGQPMGLSIVTPKLESVIALIAEPVQFQQGIQRLHNSSLVTHRYNMDSSEPEADTSVLRIHDLIKIMIQESVKKEDTHYLWFHVAVALVCGAFQLIDDPTSHLCWAQCETLNPHVHSLTMWDEEHAVENSELHLANIGIAEYFTSRGRYDEAEELFRKALARNDKVFGPEHIDTLWTVESLATTYYSQGRYEEAEALQQRVLAGRKKVLGNKHTDTMGALNNLALTYQSQSRYKEAEALYLKALKGNEKLLGPGHPDVLRIVDNLAIIYRLEKRYGEAEELFRRVMKGRQMLFGDEHPDTLGTMNNLGTVYLRQKRYTEAERQYKQALAGTKKLLGSDHPDTLSTMHNLAFAYNSQGQYSEAERLYRHALEGREKMLGSEHPDTLWTVRALADFFRQHGRNSERIDLQNRFPLAFRSR